MTIQEAIAARRSIRKFGPGPVGREQLARIIAAGAAAPSSKNRQPWHFTAVGGAAKAAMLDAMARGIAREQREPLLPGSNQHIPGALHTLRIMGQAPVTVLVSNPLEPAMTPPDSMEADFYHLANAQSVGAAVQNMALAALGEGLGTLWICDIDFAMPELLDWLGSDRLLVAALAVGHPAEAPSARPRKPVEETVTWMME